MLISSSQESTIDQSQQINYSILYEQIGNIIIERAYAGDKVCEDIYKRAYFKYKEIFN